MRRSAPPACRRGGAFLSREMPVAAIGALVDAYDTRIWRVIHYDVESARDGADHSEVRQVAVDETASRRGHNYMRLFFDLGSK